MLTLPVVEKPRQGTPFPSLPHRGRQRITVAMTEACEPDSTGSMGCQYVMNAARNDGWDIVYEYPRTTPVDLELVSVHHCTDFPRLAQMPRLSRLRIVGGHPTVNNIRPAVPFADAFCIGEGETWIVHALRRLNDDLSTTAIDDLPGTLIPRGYSGVIPRGNTEESVPRHPAYLNVGRGNHARVWYLEMARGCPFRCSYCELGWAWKYRLQDTSWLLSQIDGIDRLQSRKVSLFAPDEASHPGYGDILERIHQRRLTTSFGSMRLDVILKKNLPFKSNMLIRVALDGLTEKTRFQTGRKIRDEEVYEYFRFMADRGHRNFKVFMVFGYPWESTSDFDDWEALWERISRIPVRTNARVRMKFTPLIPQPSTPLGDCEPQYRAEMINRIKCWFDRVGKPWTRPGWFIHNDGLMSQRSHRLQVMLTRGDENLLLGHEDWRGTETLKGYDVFD